MDDRWRVARLALAETARAAAGTAAGAARRLALLGAPTPARVLIAPHDLRTSDPTAATDIYAGRFIFAGQAVQTGGDSPFAALPPSVSWAEALYGFGWLRHLRAADTVLARQTARALLDEFLARAPAAPGIARRPPVVARRLISLLGGSPLILEGADHAFYQRVLRAVGGAVRDLDVAVAAGLPPAERLAALVALAYAGLCCEGLDKVLGRTSRLLERELDAQILPDGGHVSRNPRLLVELLLDLLPLRQTYAGRRLEPPGALVRAIDRALPMLRLLRHGDGSLSHFNGMGASAADHVATLLIYDSARGSAPPHASRSGYARLEAGATLLVADVGPPPPLRVSAEAHAGCLSFELSSGAQRIVVNSGAPRGPAQAMRAARATPAHATAALAGLSSCRFLEPASPASRWLVRRLGPVLLGGPGTVTLERDPAALLASHDGYRSALGLVHERRWEMAEDGAWLRGEDRFPGEAAGPVEAAIRFPLHPAVRAERVGDAAVLLALPGGERWQFSAEAGRIGIEESVFFAAPEGARRAAQIVLVAAAADGARWRFERLDEAHAAGAGSVNPDLEP